MPEQEIIRRLVGGLDAESIHALYCMKFGTALFANDEDVVVLDCGDDIVVISDLDALKRLRPELIQALLRRGAVFAVSAWSVPFPWRKRILGLVPFVGVTSGGHAKVQLTNLLSKCEVIRLKEI
jgi:hypothetical protein